MIIALIIIGGIYGGIRDRSNTSPDTEIVKTLPTETDMSALMASMDILQINEPALSSDFFLMSIAEEEISLNQQRGKVVLLSFWTTW